MPHYVVLKQALLFDGVGDTLIENASVVIENGNGP